LLPQLQQPQLLLLEIIQHQYHMEYLHHLIMDKKPENRRKKKDKIFVSFECAYMFIISVFFCLLVTFEKIYYILWCISSFDFAEIFWHYKKKTTKRIAFAPQTSRHITSNECVNMEGRKNTNDKGK
jgi:hypothetical protein